MAQTDDPSGVRPRGSSELGSDLQGSPRKTSDPDEDDAWLDILNAPLPSEVATRSAPARVSRSPEPQRDPEPSFQTRQLTPPPTRRRGSARRRVRRTIKHVDPLSVLKVSLAGYTVALVVWLGVVALVYAFLSSLGLFEQINSIMRGIGEKEVFVDLALVERWALIAGVVFLVLGSIINVAIAVVYNVISNLMGGVEVTFLERDG